jgi:signal transduction histidine kinase
VSLSLRSRLLLAWALWTVALFVFNGSIGMLLLTVWPDGRALAHRGALLVLSASCVLLALWQFRMGITPINRLRQRLGDVHHGRESRVRGDYPAEVQPLVDDLNALLEHREEAVTRARWTAGDLAHGLKTPLAVLAQAAERAELEGRPDLAATIDQQVSRMQRQAQYHLAHARAAASGAAPGAHCAVRPALDGLARTLQRLHASRNLIIDVTVPNTAAVRAQHEDVEEIFGNVLDNACKWARARVAVSTETQHGLVTTHVDDDGGGLAPELRQAVLERGVRGDQDTAGSGLGLAITRELVELHRGSLVLGDSPLGGLRVSVALPADPR